MVDVLLHLEHAEGVGYQVSVWQADALTGRSQQVAEPVPWVPMDDESPGEPPPPPLPLPDQIGLTLFALRGKLEDMRIWVSGPERITALCWERLQISPWPAVISKPVTRDPFVELVRWAGSLEDWPPADNLPWQGKLRVVIVECPHHPAHAGKEIDGVKAAAVEARSSLGELVKQGRAVVQSVVLNRDGLEGLDSIEGPVDLLIYLGHSESGVTNPAGDGPFDLFVSVPGVEDYLMPLHELLRRLQPVNGPPVRAVFLNSCNGAGAWNLLNRSRGPDDQRFGAGAPTQPYASCGIYGEIGGLPMEALMKGLCGGLADHGLFYKACREGLELARRERGPDGPWQGEVALGRNTVRDWQVPSRAEVLRHEYLEAAVKAFGYLTGPDGPLPPGVYQPLPLMVPVTRAGVKRGKNSESGWVTVTGQARSVHLLDYLQQKRRSVQLLADAGQGKTTLLRHTACSLAVHRGVIPLYVHLGRWRKKEDVLDAAIREARAGEQLDAETRSLLKDVLGQAVRNGEAVLLVDGVDEVAPANLRRCGRALRDFMGQPTPTISVVVASRPTGEVFNLKQYLGFGEPCYLALLNPGQVEQMAALCLARAMAGEGQPGDAMRDFLDHLYLSPESWAMSQNPFLLQVITSIYLRDDRLPASARELYDKLMTHLIGRRVAGALEEPWEALEVVANQMIENSRGRLSRKELLKHDLFRGKPGMVRRLVEAGLLTRLADEYFCFMHHSFLEHYGGMWLADVLAHREGMDRVLEWIKAEVIATDQGTCTPSRFEVVRWAGAGLSDDAVEELVHWLVDNDDLIYRGTILAMRLLTVCSDEAFLRCWGVVDRRLRMLLDEAAGEQILATVPPTGSLMSFHQRQADLEERLPPANEGPCWEPILSRLLVNESVDLEHVIRLLSLLQVRSSAATIKTHLGSLDDGVRGAAIQAMGALRFREAIPALVELLGEDSPPHHRCAAVEALVSLGARDRSDELIGLLGATDPTVQCAAARALGLLGCGGAAPLLEPLLLSDNSKVSAAAAEALRSLGQFQDAPRAVRRPDPNQGGFQEAARVLVRSFGVRYIPAIVELLDNPDFEVRAAAVTALGRTRRPDVAPRITHLLGDSSWQVSQATADALIALGAGQVVDQITPYLDRDQDNIIINAVRVLGTPGEDTVAEKLVSLLKTAGRYVREAATDALISMGTEKVAREVSLLLVSRRPEVRQAAVRILAALDFWIT